MTTKTRKDYYRILGIRQNATISEIKRAYRKLARKYHPDTSDDPDAAERFKEITEAYETLTDPERRDAYDQTYRPTADTRPANDDTPSQVASRVLQVLEDIWRDIRARHPEIPAVIIILASGTEGKHTRWGHHAPRRWRVHEHDRAEIMISGEGLKRTPREVLGTLMHEAAHALADARGIKDTSRQGRYHNTKFKDLANELGIDVDKDEKLGWTITTVPDATLNGYRDAVERLQEAMTLWRRSETTGPKATRNSNLIAAICPCERTIRIARTSLDQAPVTCGACGGDFELKPTA